VIRSPVEDFMAHLATDRLHCWPRKGAGPQAHGRAVRAPMGTPWPRLV